MSAVIVVAVVVVVIPLKAISFPATLDRILSPYLHLITPPKWLSHQPYGVKYYLCFSIHFKYYLLY